MNKICNKLKIIILCFSLFVFVIACSNETSSLITTMSIEPNTTISSTSSITTTSSVDTTMTFVVSFDVGLGSDVDSISVASGSSMSLPITEREGYNFLGWTLIDTAEAEIVDEPFQPNSNITLYAKWSVNQYTISFNTNGGSVIDPITQDYGTDILQPDVPTKEGDTFGGWYSDSELTTAYTFSTMPSENITVYAKWDAIDWSDVEPYLINLIPNELSNNISLPSTYLDYSISWLSSHPEILSNAGIYIRPYQATTVSLSAIIQLGQQTLTKIYNIEVDGYKSLSAPLTSSYIYRDYNLVSDSFFTTLDIINCAFITANSAGTLSGTAVLGNINTYIMPKAHENGNWVIFSIAPDSDWSAIASNSNRINTFADNIVAMINAYGFDGVDIDWETPTTEEATRFTEMMRVIYTKVKANNPNHLVTAAIAGGMWQPPRYDLVNSQQYLDYINMMTYGMVSNNGYYQNALSRSTTYDNPTNSAGKTLTSCSIEESIDIYHSYGIPNSKIIVGVAFYGIKQTRSYDVSSQTWSNWVNAGSVSYNYIINNYLNNSSYDYNYDTQAGVPYIIKTDGTVFISYDNPRSIADKSEYIIENGLAGMMYWENGLDLSGTLLLAMEVGLIEID
jgi:chitinase